MKKLTLALAISLAAPNFAAADSVGGCGLGSKIFHGQRGIAAQSLAITTNGFYGTNTFGITSGTLGCEQNGVVQSNWKVAMYLDNNLNRFAKDVSVGEGETLDSLASLLGVETADKDEFAKALKDNFSTLFSSADATSQDVVAGLFAVLNDSNSLAQYTANL